MRLSLRWAALVAAGLATAFALPAFALAGSPAPIVKRMHEELAKALKVPAVSETLTAQGMDLIGGGPEELDRFLKAEIDRWAKVVKDNKIKAGD